MRDPKDQEKLSKTKKFSRGEEHATTVLNFIMRHPTEPRPLYEEREFFRYSRGKLDIYDRIGKGLGQVKLTDEELDFVKLMENPPTQDYASKEETSDLHACGVRLRVRKRKNGNSG